MRLQQLQLLLTLARTGSMRASAAAMNVTQPALTKADQAAGGGVGSSAF